MPSKKTINTTVPKLVPMVTLTRTRKAVDTRAVVAFKFSYWGEGDKYRHGRFDRYLPFSTFP
ncbi:unknown protein [Microcystis aeruginosa NIES-843]|uniref:Uncharacterized protein n=1 Tax=Microcystis aeruginosa (strain NIES-843 / IAM M-2473) TaxID=449447 RepID=B0JM44_MICAN|nr:unknown protein [Microcystis aeruginosa NIES-843]